MRRAAVVAILLVLTLGGVANAAPPVAMVTGTYNYFVNPDNPDTSRAISISARATDPVKGTFTITRSGTTVITGVFTCLRLAGADAWLAGVGNMTGYSAVFMWVHDGGTPAADRDTAFTWFSDPGETLADMEALCESMTTSPYGLDPFPVASGNVMVHPAR